jgi:hypothetical protein
VGEVGEVRADGGALAAVDVTGRALGLTEVQRLAGVPVAALDEVGFLGLGVEGLSVGRRPAGEDLLRLDRPRSFGMPARPMALRLT